MKLFTTAAMALALTGAAAAAYADNPQPPNAPPKNSQQHGQQKSGQGGGQGAGQQHGQGGGPGGQQHGQGAGAGGQQHFSGQAQAGQGQAGAGQAGRNGQGGLGGQQHFSGQAVQGGGQQQLGRGNQGQRFNGQGGASAGLAFQNHALRGRDQGRASYSANAFSRQYRAQRQFRFGGYRSYPSGWAYRPWYYGQFLPFGWYGQQYYLNWADYGLPAPPIGCEWVAQGPDALLVDVWTGEVLSVYQGVFYWNAY
jgi:Ni/Co efflux regulator RcnB